MRGKAFFYRAIVTIVILFTCYTTLSAQNTIQHFYYTNQLGDNAAACCLAQRTVLKLSFRNDFCTKELMYKSLDFIGYKKQNALYATISHYGYSAFGELKIGIGYGRVFGNKFAVALHGIYLFNHAAHYTPKHSMTIDLSAICNISSKLNLSVGLFNPIRLKYGIIGTEVIPMRFDISLLYLPSSKIGVNIFCQKELPGKFNVAAGLIIHPIDMIFIDTYCSLTDLMLGIQLPWKKLRFGISTKWHYQLGFSFQTNFYYHIS